MAGKKPLSQAQLTAFFAPRSADRFKELCIFPLFRVQSVQDETSSDSDAESISQVVKRQKISNLFKMDVVKFARINGNNAAYKTYRSLGVTSTHQVIFVLHFENWRRFGDGEKSRTVFLKTRAILQRALGVPPNLLTVKRPLQNGFSGAVEKELL